MKNMLDKNYRILRWEYWKLLVAQKANIDEFGKKNQNIEQRILQMQQVFWALGMGVPAYNDMEYLIKSQNWRFNIDKHGSRFYTYITPHNTVGSVVKHVPDDLVKFVHRRHNCIR